MEKSVNPFMARTLRSLQRNILSGLITMGPLFVTWIVFSFVFRTLADAGLPAIKLLAEMFPDGLFGQEWLQLVLAFLLTLTLLYLVGRVTSQVIGREALVIFETALERLPFVAKVYTSVRQLLDTMMTKNETSQRVVLVDFPIVGQKSIGFLTRSFACSTSGQPLAAVLLPNAINPISGLLQIVPMEMVTETDLTMEQAMSLIMTGGAVGPETLRYTKGSAQ
jgi:uncharacterized membrane protein